ncbi:hypothetical protein LR48_Vigan02g011700 [Vigna angularis]|uniref:Uncharacterized protein n=1 Tax=Phaseolus angularis TaxID=3914 RepID=A0A0L9TUB1_PHAAN|nr:hypothetical protein LR48_Vigan02g011700 [Vigna angularis]
MDSKDVNGCIMDKHKPVVASSLRSEKVEDHVNGDDDSDSNSLLPPRRGGMSRNSDKTRRSVQWNDRNGNKLAEVLEYEPRYLFFINSVNLSEFSLAVLNSKIVILC